MKQWNPLLASYWALQLATGAKNFSKNPLIGSSSLNEHGLHEFRVTMAHRMARFRRSHLAHGVNDEDRAAFEESGFVEKENFLSPRDFSILRDKLFKFRGRARDMVQGDTITRRFAAEGQLLSAVPQLRGLLEDPRWRALIRYVGSFDQEPLVYLQSIFNKARDGDPDPQTFFHADTFHPTVKAWLFLTDVPEDEGPFCYVPGSHRLTPERLAWERDMSLKAPAGVDRLSARGSFRVSEEQLAAMALPRPRAFAVPANTLVVGDTFGFHCRGPCRRPAIRIEIWAYGRRNPFLPWTGLDLGKLPGVHERRIEMMWAIRDRYRSALGQPWQDVGDKTAQVL